MPDTRQQDPFAPGSGVNNTGTSYDSGNGTGSEQPPPTDSTAVNSYMPQPISSPGSFLSGLGNIVGNQLNNFTGALSNPMLIPSMAAAYQQYQQAHQYTDMAEKYAGQLDPFGQQRSYYQNLLQQSYSDPNIALNDPAHQQELQHGLDNVARTGAAQGFLGSGNMMTSLEDYAHNSDADWLNSYRQGLITPSGANIGPQSAAGMLQTGLLGRMGAENNAIGNMMVPFMNQNAQNQGKQPGTTTNGGGGSPLSAANAGQAIQRLTSAGMNPQTAAQLVQAAIQNPGNMSPGDIQLLNSLGYGPGNSGADVAPPGYTDNTYGSGIDPSYGMDPNQGVNSSTTSINSLQDPTFSQNWNGGYGSNIVTDGAQTFPYDNSGSVDWDNWDPGSSGGDNFWDIGAYG